MNKKFIHDGINDRPDKLIKGEIQNLMIYDYQFGVPRLEWKKFKPVIKFYPDATTRVNEIDTTFGNALSTGEMYIDNEIQPYLYTPFFCKDETNKVRLIYNYSYKYDGINSLNALVPKSQTTVEFPTLRDLIQFVHNDGKTEYIGKNDGASFFRQIELSPQERPLAVYYWRGYKIVDTRMPCMYIDKYSYNV